MIYVIFIIINGFITFFGMAIRESIFPCILTNKFNSLTEICWLECKEKFTVRKHFVCRKIFRYYQLQIYNATNVQFLTLQKSNKTLNNQWNNTTPSGRSIYSSPSFLHKQFRNPAISSSLLDISSTQ